MCSACVPILVGGASPVSEHISTLKFEENFLSGGMMKSSSFSFSV